MTITIKEAGPRLWKIDVAGTLPNGTNWRKRTTQELPSRKAAHQYGEAIWKAKLEGALTSATPTVREYAEKWLIARERRGLSSAMANRYQLDHLLPSLGDIQLARLTRAQIATAVKDLERNGKRKRGAGGLAPRTVRHSYTILRTMLNDALLDGVIPANPATLSAHRDEVPTAHDKDPHWRETARYTTDELRALISDERIPMAERVAYALEGLAGLRYGEASALRWESWLADEQPLSALLIHEAYDSNNNRLKRTKTGTQRRVPVHPLLHTMLTAWREQSASKLVIPEHDGETRHKLDGRYRHTRNLVSLGFAPRRQHDLRRTFVTLCRTGGARVDLLKWISHGPPRSTMMDEYTSPDWQLLCDQVLCLKL